MGAFQKLFSDKAQSGVSPNSTIPPNSFTFVTEAHVLEWKKEAIEKYMVKLLSKADRKKYEDPGTTAIERLALRAFIQLPPGELSKFKDILVRGDTAVKAKDNRALISAIEEMKQLCTSSVSIWKKVSGIAGVCGRILSICGILFILLMLMYPPYLSLVTIRGRDGRLIAQYNTPLSHNWVWDSPSGTYNYDSVQPKTSEPHVDIEHLYIYLGIGGVVTVLGIVLMSQRLRVFSTDSV